MRTLKFKNFLETNLKKAAEEETAASLGDRSSYIGASDIGGCLFKAYCDKTNTLSQENDFQQEIVFQRGHVAETIIRKMLGKTLPIKEQVELVEDKVKCHIDFVMEGKSELVIIECKSVKAEISEPYLSWQLQVQLQMDLLKKTTDKAVTAFIIAINLNTGWLEVFLIEPDDYLLNEAKTKAQTLREALENNVAPKATEQLYCSVCKHKWQCPLYNNKNFCETTNNSQIEKLLEEAKTEQEKLKELATSLDNKKEEIKQFMLNANISKLASPNAIASLGKDSQVDKFESKALKEEMPEIYEKYLVKSIRKGAFSIK